MNGLAMMTLCLVVPDWSVGHDLDKSGTTERKIGTELRKVVANKPLREADRAGTERAGFEPAVRFYPYAALAKRCFRPLSHLSGTAMQLR